MAASSTKLDVPIVRRRSVLVEIAEIVEDAARSITTVVDQVELVVAIINGRSTGAEGHAPSYRSEISLRDRHADRGRASSAPGRARRRATNSEARQDGGREAAVRLQRACRSGRGGHRDGWLDETTQR